MSRASVTLVRQLTWAWQCHKHHTTQGRIYNENANVMKRERFRILGSGLTLFPWVEVEGKRTEEGFQDAEGVHRGGTLVLSFRNNNEWGTLPANVSGHLLSWSTRGKR